MKQTKKINGQIVGIIVLLALLLIFIFGYQFVEAKIYEIWPNNLASHADYNLPKLTIEFLRVAFTACLISVPIGFFVGLFCFSDLGKSFRLVVDKISTVLNTVPTIAVLFLLTSIIGFGMWPSVVALVIQAILPIIFATVAGISNVPEVYLDAARGIGMTRQQILWKIQIPMASPVILNGIKTSMILCVAASTMAANTGAGGLGRLIFAGYSTYNNIYVFEGTIPITLLALLIDQAIKYIEGRANKRVGSTS